MAALLTSMLKITVSPERLTPKRLGISDGKVDGFSIGGNNVEYAKKSGKLSKSGKSKSKKMSKSQNSAKSGKKLSKNGNLTNFNATKNGPKFLTPDARTAFNRLRLTFTEAPILRHFNLECHI